MKRFTKFPRADWESKVERLGLTFHHTYPQDGRVLLYWDESAYYAFSMEEILELERVTNELHQMCLEAAQYIIDRDRFVDLAIPPAAIPFIKRAWEEEPPSVYARFDLRYDGVSPPKLLEYNADTPTGLLEASVIQWHWLQELFPEKDQFNSLHERLVAKWQELKPYLYSNIVHFAYGRNLDTEDFMNTQYMRDTAEQAGLQTDALLINDIGWDQELQCFVDLDNRRIQTLFKLYPWEWILQEKFGPYLLNTYHQMQWVEPIWKMLLSNKGILPILWELYPGHPNLLPTYFDGPHGMKEYVRKPLLGREGSNVTIVSKNAAFETGGEYGEEGYVYQAFCPLPQFDGKYPVIGSWVIDGESAGMGIRESDDLVTRNWTRFVPHLIQ